MESEYKGYDIIRQLVKSGKFKLSGKISIIQPLHIRVVHVPKVDIDIHVFKPLSDDYFVYSNSMFKWYNHIRGLKTVDFMGEEYQVPTNADEYLTELYGSDWRIPDNYVYHEGLSKGKYKNRVNLLKKTRR